MRIGYVRQVIGARRVGLGVGVRMVRAGVVALLVMAAALAGGGCAVRYVDYTRFIDETPVDEASAFYRIGWPDELRIGSTAMPELDGVRVTVDRDGQIDLPRLGPVRAAGLTPEQLARELSHRLALDNHDAAEHEPAEPEADADTDADAPAVVVRVERYASQRVFVWGEVGAPGPQAYDGANTALAALAVARPTARANPRNILVLEPTSQGDYQLRGRIDLQALWRGDAGASDIALRPGDIVHVPPHPLTPGMGQHVDAPRGLAWRDRRRR